MAQSVAKLAINTLRLSVSLGVTAEERAQPQPVEVDIHFHFERLPDCCADDNAEDFICYDEVCQAAMEYVDGTEFRMLEYLTMQLHRVIRDHLSAKLGKGAEKISLWIRLRKCTPPVPYMINGAEFIYSDHPDITGI